MGTTDPAKNLHLKHPVLMPPRRADRYRKVALYCGRLGAKTIGSAKLLVRLPRQAPKAVRGFCTS